MSRNRDRERQWRQTLEAAAAWRQRPAPEAGAAPRSGELYLSRRSGRFPVQWLVVDDTEDGRLRLVPVDDHPLVGSRDMLLPSPALGGAAVARCGLEATVQASGLERELHTGTLAAVDLEHVQARRRAATRSRPDRSLREDVVDGDPAYQRWIEGTLRPALAALTATESAPARPPWAVDPSRRPWRSLAIAAMLTAVLGTSGYLWRIDAQLAAARNQLAALEARRAEQSARLVAETRQRRAVETEAGRLEALLLDAREDLGAAQGQLGRGRRSFEPRVAVNVRKLVFGSQARFSREGKRGQPVVLERDSGALALLEVEVVDAEPYPTYRLCLEPTKAGRSLTIEGLSRDGAWLRSVLPVEELMPGQYLLLIEGMGLGQPVELNERYRLTVEP